MAAMFTAMLLVCSATAVSAWLAVRQRRLQNRTVSVASTHEAKGCKSGVENLKIQLIIFWYEVGTNPPTDKEFGKNRAG
jgi:hypothetical protein